MTQPDVEPREPDDPTAYALAKHIADHPVSTIQAAFRYLNAPLMIELREEPAVVPPVDRAALRDRIAEVLYERKRPPRDPHWPKTFASDRETFEAMADAVLAVLPETVDRAAVLREAADAIDAETRQAKADGVLEPDKYRPCRDASAQLRRMADETEDAADEAVTAEDRESYHRWLKEAETARDEARLQLSRVIGERDRLARDVDDLLQQEADLIVAHCPKHGPKDQTGFWLDCHCAVADDMRRRAEAVVEARQDGAQS